MSEVYSNLPCARSSLACTCGGFSLKSGLTVSLHLAVLILLVWGTLSLTLPQGNRFAPLTLAQVNLNEQLSQENPNKRTWNSKTWDLYEGNGRFKTEFHSKWINYLDADNHWQAINPTLKEYPITDPDYYSDDQLPFKVKIPNTSVGTAYFISNNRYDIFKNKKIDEPPLTQTIQALDVQNVSGVLENYQANNQQGSGGPLNSVRYPLAYPQYNADLIYWLHDGQAPRLNKLIKFTTNPYVKEDVRLRFKISFDQPTEIEAESAPESVNPDSTPTPSLGVGVEPAAVPPVTPSAVEGSPTSTERAPSTAPADAGSARADQPNPSSAGAGEGQGEGSTSSTTSTPADTVTASLLEETTTPASATSTTSHNQEKKADKVQSVNQLAEFSTGSNSNLPFERTERVENPGHQRKKWNKQNKLTTSHHLAIREAGAASSSPRGLGFQDFYVWDSSPSGNRQHIQVEFEPVENQPNTFILTKIIPKAYLDIATYPVYTDTTTTFFPDPDPETTSVDGIVWRIPGAAEAFSTIRSGAGTNVQDATNPENLATLRRNTATSNCFTEMGRNITLFDTSSIGSGSTVDSATLSFFGSSKNDAMSQSVNITSSAPASNTGLVASDYAIANFGSTNFSTGITIASWSNVAYNDFALNSSGLSNISVTGISKFSARLSGDIDNSAPTCPGTAASALVTVNYAEATGTANDPKLVVTYTGAASSAFFLLFD